MIETIDWKAEILRITVFPVDTASLSAEDSWKHIIDEQPDNLQVQRSGLETREIKYGNGRIVLIKQRDRIEWRYLSNPIDESLNLPIIGNFTEELQTFLRLAVSWLEYINAFPLNRIAFGVVLLFPVAGLDEGKEVLGNLFAVF